MTIVFMWPQGCPYRAALEHWLLRQGAGVADCQPGQRLSGASAPGPAWRGAQRRVRSIRQGRGVRGLRVSWLTAIENLFYWHENAGVHPAREAFVAMLREEFA